MPYVERNKDKVISAIYNRPQPGRAEEYLPDDNAEIVDYLKEPEPSTEPSEMELLKLRLSGIENILVTKEVITLAEKEAIREPTDPITKG